MSEPWDEERHRSVALLCHGAHMPSFDEAVKRQRRMAAALPDALAEIERLQAEVKRLTPGSDTLITGLWTQGKHNILSRFATARLRPGETDDAAILAQGVVDALEEIDRLRAENEALRVEKHALIAARDWLLAEMEFENPSIREELAHRETFAGKPVLTPEEAVKL